MVRSLPRAPSLCEAVSHDLEISGLASMGACTAPPALSPAMFKTRVYGHKDFFLLLLLSFYFL